MENQSGADSTDKRSKEESEKVKPTESEERQPSMGEESKEQGQTEKVGSFKSGNCPFCGREWHVTLPGAPDEAFPTQKAADAAAGRACDCEGSRKNCNGITGVTFSVTMGSCKYCGQLITVGAGYYSQTAADTAATELCDCPEASRARRIEKQIEDARERIQQLFGPAARALSFVPIDKQETIELLNNMVEQVARQYISSATIQICGFCRAKNSYTNKDKIKIERSEARSYQLEDSQ